MAGKPAVLTRIMDSDWQLKTNSCRSHWCCQWCFRW